MVDEELEELRQRVEKVEADLAIRSLLARYATVMDDRDVAAIPALFTRDAKITSEDGKMDAQGRDLIVELYEGRFALLGATHHIVHGMDITVLGPAAARGVVSSTAEVWRNGGHQLVALRYLDNYAKEDGAWRIASRHFMLFYYVPVEQYAGILGTLHRNLTYGEPIEADFPENTASFKKYMRDHPQ